MDFLKHSKVAYFLYLMDEIMDYSHVDSKVSAEAPQDQKPYIIVNTLQKLFNTIRKVTERSGWEASKKQTF